MSEAHAREGGDPLTPAMDLIRAAETQRSIEARALATDICVLLMENDGFTEVRGPDRIVTADAGFSVLAVRNGIEMWVDVRARP